MEGVQEGLLAVDVSLDQEFHQRLFEAERPALLGHGDLLMEVLQCLAPEMLLGSIAQHEQFGRGHASTNSTWQKNLCVDGGQGHGQLLPDRVLPLQRERISYAVDGGS